MMFYLIILKYNLTNETYLPETISNFPGAPEMTLTNMLGVSLFYNTIPLALSFVTYYPIVYLTRKLFKTRNSLSLIMAGFFLTLTTPTIYFALSEWNHNDYYLKTAEVIAWSLCFVSSIITYYLLNKSDINSDKFEPIKAIEMNG